MEWFDKKKFTADDLAADSISGGNSKFNRTILQGNWSGGEKPGTVDFSGSEISGIFGFQRKCVKIIKYSIFKAGFLDTIA